MTTELLIEEAEAIELLDELAAINEEIAPLKKRKDAITDQLKQFMALNDMRELRDGELGITARMQERNKPPSYDLASAPEESVVQAARNHLLSLDHTSFKRLRNNDGALWMDMLAKYEMPGGIVEALIIERDR